MNYDKESFKAEVRRRGGERIAKRKRIRKQITVCVIPMFVCVIAAAVLVPRLWLGMSDEAADMLMENGTETIAPAYGLDGDENFEMSPPAGDMLPSEPAPDMEDSDEEMPGYTTSVYSVEVTAWEDGGNSLLHTDSNHLVDIGSLLQSINESDRDELPDGTTGKSETGYRIIVTYRFDDQDEYIWSGACWYIVEEERTVALTSDEIEALTTLLLESKAN